MNGISVCLDEIGLEGLDGITLSTLWRRLSSATPRLWSTLDDSYKEFLWKSVVSSQNVQTFLLEKPREELKDFVDDSKTYPFCCINDEKSGVRGSCSTFNSRKLVDLSKERLQVVEQEYGSSVVLVASQVLRERAIFGPEFDPFVDISDIAYCLLEWVGRGRKLGRIQSSCSLFTSMDPATNFHYFKILQEQHTVTRQVVIINDGIRVKTNVVYLPRFHVEHTRDSLAYKICNMLEKSEEHLSLEHFCLHFGEPQETVKKCLQELCESGHIRYLDGSVCDYNGLLKDCGSVPEQEGAEATRCQTEDVMQLIQPFYNMCYDDVDDDDDADADEEDESATNPEWAPRVHAELSLHNSIYQLIDSKGIKGITVAECVQYFGLPYSDVRTALSQLESAQKLAVIFDDIGRQRMTRYIASKTLKQHCDEFEGAVQTEIQPAEPEVCQDKPSTTKENMEHSRNPINIFEATRDNSCGLTEKFQKRRNIVLDFLSKEKVIDGEFAVRKLINEKEAENGLLGKMDVKTSRRFLEKLKDAGSIQIININVEVENKNHALTLVCDSKIKEDCPEVLAKVSKFKDKLRTKIAKEAGETKPVVNKLQSCQVVPKSKGAKRGYLPKMPRCELLHVFLFYLVYELAKPDVNLEAWRKKYDWAEHLTPSHSPKDIGNGWFTAASIFMLLPLSLYVKLIGVTFQSNVLDQCIDNPATKHMLIRDLPSLERYLLTMNRRHFTVLLGSLELLAEFKLITPTSKLPFTCAKDVACRLNKSAVLKDTRESLPGYGEVEHPEGEQFPETVFTFSSLSDVDQYWAMTQRICLATQLNVRAKPYKLKKRMRPSLKEFVTDDENVLTSIKPCGDGLGAAGFDSKLYCHLGINWSWENGEDKQLPVVIEDGDHSVSSDWQLCFTTATIPAKSVAKSTGGRGKKRKLNQPTNDGKAPKKGKLSKNNIKKNKKPQQTNSCSDASTIHKGQPSEASTSQKNQPSKASTNQESQPSTKTNIKKKKTKVKKKKKDRSHWSSKVRDQRDIEATKRKEVLRVTFTPQEQKLLFICTLALRILGKKSTDTGYTDWLWTRDILYKDNYETAKTKTAMSISRKYRTIMSNPQTKVNLNICTADCMQETEFQPYCNLGKSCDEVAFNKLVDLLKAKYNEENMEKRPLSLPHNLKAIQELKELQSDLLQLKNPEKCDEDIASLKTPVTSLSNIRQGIIRDAIFSALLLENERYDPNIAYAFLDQFTEDELSEAINWLKQKNMIVRKSLRYCQGRNLALTAFSQCLSSTGRRILEAHFPSCVVNEARSFYEQVQQGGTHSRQYLPAVEKSESLTLSEDSVLGGHVACILSLLTAGKLSVEIEVPENILHVEFANDSKELKGALPSTLVDKKEQDALVSRVDPQQTTRVKNTEACFIDSEPDLMKDTDRSFQIPSAENTGKDVQMVLPNGFGEEDEEVEIDPISATDLVEENTSILSMSPSEIHKDNVYDRAADSKKVVQQRETLGDEDTNDIRFIHTGEGTSLDASCKRKTGNKELLHKKNKKVGETSINIGSSYPNRSSTSFVDVLSGIEDHLFGYFGQSSNASLYKADLQSKSNFTCRLTTSYVGNSDEMSDNRLINIQRSAALSTNRSCDYYNDKIIPARMAGAMIKPYIKLNPCNVKLSLLPPPEQEATSRKSDSAAKLVAQYFKASTCAMPLNIDECTSVCSKEFGYTEEDCQALAIVYDAIESSQEVGISCSKVNNMVKQHGFFSRFSTEGLVEVLEAFKLVCQVGLVEARFVTTSFKKHWCLCFPYETVDHSPSATNKDTLVDAEQQMASCGTQTDGPPRNDHIHCMPIVSTVAEKKADDLRVGGTSFVSDAMPSGLICAESHTDKTGHDREEELLMVQAGSLVSDPMNDIETKTVPKASNTEENMLSVQDLKVRQSDPLSRPWYCMDGQMNEKAYNTLHESVLCYIIRYPGVREFTIAKHFVNMIYPVTLRRVLQTLEEGSCIKKRCFNQKKATLFSSNTPGDKVTYFLPTADALIKLKNVLI